MNNSTQPPRCRSSRPLQRIVGVIFAMTAAWNATATNHILRQDELMVGLNGNPNVQFIQITVADGTQKSWGPGPGETTSRAMLVFFNGVGALTGQFFFPSNAPIGQTTVLIATTNFANIPGAPVPDFIIPPLLSPTNGKVCFRGNPANPNAFAVNLCLSYGNFPPSLTEGGGPPAPALPMSGEPMSLTRVSNFAFGGGTINSDFNLATPTPVNTRGQTISFATPGPEIDFIPTNVNFGFRDFTLGPSGSQTITITNRGVVNSLAISNVSLVGTDLNQFILINDTGQNSLAPNGSRSVRLAFHPDSAGPKVAALRVVSNDENEGIVLVPIRGTGVDPNAPEIDVTPPSINFGVEDVAIGLTQPVTVTITNQGTVGSLFITNITLAGADASQFSLLGSTNKSTMGPRSQRNILVAFTPTTAGIKTAVLRIISSDSDEGVFDVVLQGKAFDLNPCVAPNPTNSVAQDDCANAQLICPGMVFSGSTSGATPDGSSTCGPASAPDVWFRYVPAVSGTASVSVVGTAFTPMLSAHSGCPGTNTNQLACNAAGGVQGVAAAITFGVTNGSAVFIRVAGPSPTNGSFQLTITGPPCFNFDGNENGITDGCEFDFGDAPAPYPTTLAADGARHLAFSGLFLGNRIDPNPDGLPTPFATGDNEDGPLNDEDGVLFNTPLIVGQQATVSLQASSNGLLNAWIDFNANGDWIGIGEQVFTNTPLQPGINTLSFLVPSNAIPTNLTFARFRFSSVPGLSFKGPAPDGEVEDYAVEILSQSQAPSQMGVRIKEVMAGLNGDSSAQFVQLEVDGDSSRAWGPQAGESVGRAMLAFFDQAGRRTGRFVFPTNAPSGGNLILVGTRAFMDQTGLVPDFIMPPEVVAIAGKLGFLSNPDNHHFDINVALAYGGIGYFGTTDGAGPANTNELPILSAKSLARTADIPFGLNSNAAFQLSAPSPHNAAGGTVSLLAKSLVDQGETLFKRETFRGNGRTCATCHVSGKDQFSLTSTKIAALPGDDPLFVFEQNVNLLTISGASQPSDLRGNIFGATASAKVLSGSGDTYLVIGGTNLSGAIMDLNGNTGVVQTVRLGDLNGPTLSNGSQRGLESHPILEHGLGLVLENIDGFNRGEVFRASPHLLQLGFTAPYGLSGEFDNLEDFSDGAVVQHFPRSMSRLSGLDFRHPTREELQAMTAFMLAIPGPTADQLGLDRFATTEAQKRGRALFFGEQGRCAKCHSGPVLALSDGTLPGSIKDRNENFDTGVANSMRNILDNLPTEPAGLTPGKSTREFNVPSLFNIRLTAPYFHDASAATLTDAVKFYDTEDFHNSPAGQQVGSLLAANKTNLVADLVAFLESLVVLPIDFTRALPFGIHCPADPIRIPLPLTITNLSQTTIAIANLAIVGTNASDFNIIGDSGETNLAPAQIRTVTIAFTPASFGPKQAMLEVIALDTNLLRVFSFGVALTGEDLDNFVQASPSALDFGTRDIDAPPSPEESIVITNRGSIDLPFSIELAGSATNDFTLITDTNAIPPQSLKVLQVTFAPRTQGVKSALVRVHMVSCSGTLIEIPLAAIATSTVHHFAWDPLNATQYVGLPFPVRIAAMDRNNQVVPAYRGAVRLMSVAGTRTNAVTIAPSGSTPFVDGVWNGSMTIMQTSPSMKLLAIDSQGHSGLSDPFIAPLLDDLVLTVSDSPDPDNTGQAITYTLSVFNTGPNDATGVVVTNLLSPDVTFVSAIASQGDITQADGTIVAQLGSLSRAATATVTILAEPKPGPTNIVNLANVARNEPELTVANNFVATTTAIGQFGVLVVSSVTNSSSSGFSGGPFTPTNQIYLLSNAGNAALSWLVKGGGCTLPDGITAWWPLEGNALDSVGTNTGRFTGSPVFTNGLAGQALRFNAGADGMRMSASASLNVGTNGGMTLEGWINVPDLRLNPIFEWNDETVNVGPHLWVSQNATGTLFANLVDTANLSHQIISAPNVINAGVWQHVALTYNRVTGTAILYVNGNPVQQTNLGVFTPRTGIDFWLGRRASIGFTQSLLGSIDEPAVYGRDLSAAEIGAIFLAGSAGKCSSVSGKSGCTPLAGTVASWPFDGDTVDRVFATTGVILGNPVFTNGLVGQALFFDGVGDGVASMPTNSLDVGTNDGFSVEMWVNMPSTGRRNPVFEWDDLTGAPFSGPFLFTGVEGPGSVHAEITGVGNSIHVIANGSNLFGPNAWHHLALTYNRITGTARIYVDGAIVQEQNLGSFIPKTTGNLFIGHRATPGAEETFLGMIDEPSVFNRELSLADVQSIFQAGSSGKCQDRSWFSIAPAAGTLVPGSSTNVTWMLNTNANQLGVGTYVAPLVFTNASSARGSSGRTASLIVLNRQPTLDSLLPIQIAEDSGPRTVNLTGIGAGGSERQNLTITAFSDNLGLIANPIVVNYTSAATNGTLVFRSLTNANGSALVSVVVHDDGGVAFGAFDAITNSFTVTVTPVNDPPTLGIIPNQTVNEGELLLVTTSANDVDLPNDQLIFSLLSPPAGAIIDPLSGIFSWTPSKPQAPGTNTIAVVVRDSGTPQLSATNRFTVVVLARPVFQTVSFSGTNVFLNWSSVAGVTYRVLFKEKLEDQNWSALPGDVVSLGATASKMDVINSPQRFYRLQVVP